MENTILPASILRRLSNYIIDRFTSSVILVIILMILSYERVDDTTLGVVYIILGIAGYFLYFVICESLWQKTLGKVLTKTKVVDREGNKPSFSKILGRSISRYIPFEAFSFLIGNTPIGWHDALSKTLVVPAHYTPEDVKKMNFVEIKKNNSGNIVVTVVVIAVAGLYMLVIIGILSSVVLVSLNSARHKAEEARAKAILMQERTAQEILNLK